MQALSMNDRSKNSNDGRSEFEIKFFQSWSKISRANVLASGLGVRPFESRSLIICRAVSGIQLYPLEAKLSSKLVLPPPGPPVII